MFSAGGGSRMEQSDLWHAYSLALPAATQVWVLASTKNIIYLMVLVVGVEPTRPFELGILSPVRLPFRHTSSKLRYLLIFAKQVCQKVAP